MPRFATRRWFSGHQERAGHRDELPKPSSHVGWSYLERGQVIKIREPLPEWVERAYAEPIEQFREVIADG